MVSLPVNFPDLSELSNTELQLLRTVLAKKIKEARKDAVKLLGKTPLIRDLWVKAVSIPASVSIEERANLLSPFQAEVLHHPDAFLAHSWANSLCMLDSHIRDEVLRRSKEPVAKRTKGKD